jgi:undecaprenyl-diphosphatase
MPADHDHSLEVRLTAAAAGAVALLVPFTLIAVLVVGNVSWLHRLDARVTDALHDVALDHPLWVRVMEVWSMAFDPWVWRAGALLLIVWLVRHGSRSLAWWVGVTMVAGGLLGVVLKLLVGRHRPELLDPVARAVGFAFPSGHALNSALGAAVLLLVLLPLVRHRPGLRVALWVAAFVVPVLTAVSRVALGVHWVSDVTAGLILGVAVVAVTAAAFQAVRHGRQRSPVAANRVKA